MVVNTTRECSETYELALALHQLLAVEARQEDHVMRRMLMVAAPR